MKINTKQTTTKEFVLSEKEANTVKKCLDYCWHRLSKHKKCGINGVVDVNDVATLREGIGFDFDKCPNYYNHELEYFFDGIKIGKKTID